MPTIIDLSALGTRGFSIVGDAADDRAGISVSGAGDVNGDGFADVIVGATGNDAGGPNAGAAYVIFGKAGGFGTIDLTGLAPTDGFSIRGGAASDYAGRSVSAAGDLNGDGFADLVVGADRNDAGGAQAGAAYVIFGKSSELGTIDLAALAPADGFRIQGDASGDRLGFSVSSAGDVNGDGFADIILGAYGNDAGGTYAGAAYVVYGKARGFGAIDLTALAPADGFRIQGDTENDLAGVSVASAGDINGDGFDDIIVGAIRAETGGTDFGAAYVIFGTARGRGAIDLSALPADSGFAITGSANSDQAGISVSTVGDINGDGFDDVVVGARFNDAGGPDAGAAYVIFGKGDGFRTTALGALAPADGFAIIGDAASDQAGRSVSAAGDINGDGFDDVIVGAYNNDVGGTGAGAAYVIYGKAAGFGTIDLTSLAPTDGFIVQGDATYDQAGRSVSGAGDVNGDGFDDLIVGAPDGDDGGSAAGEAYVIFGAAPTTSVTRTGTPIAQTIRGGIGDDTLDGRDGDDTLVGGSGDDILIGGAGVDTLSGGSDDDTLNGGSGGDDLSGGDGDDELRGSSGNDTVEGGAGDDLVAGNSGDDHLVGGEGSDHLIGGSGNDRLDGGLGSDTMVGGSGNDLYIVNSTGDRVSEDEDAGRDRVNSFVSYSLGTSFVEDLLLAGTAAINGAGNGLANIITGNTGTNTLNGGAGNDLLIGGAGRDILSGGTGADEFRFAGGDTSAVQALADRISDFSRTEADKIALNLIDANTATGANDAFTFIGTAAFSGVAGQLRYATSGAVTFVYGDTNGDSIADLVLRVDGTVAFIASDFVL